MSLDPLSAALDLGNTLIQRIFPDKVAQDAAKLELLKLQESGDLAKITGQLEINKVEAASASVFVSGWRPAIGWVCAGALCYQYLVKPIVTWASAAAGFNVPPMPGLDENLWQLMMGMLGMGGLRTFEKVSGVAAK